jgi:hypothetical protein
MSKAVLTFAVYQGDALLRRETVAHDIVKVGKDPKSHLRIDDDAASRMHAVVEVAGPDDVTLIDLGNEPGTLVNGARVNKCKLHAGDQIQIGGTRLVLERTDAAGAVAPGMPAEAAAPRAAAPPPPTSNPFAVGSNPFAGAPNPFAAAAASNPFGGTSNPFENATLNPFASRGGSEVPDDAPPGTYTYTLVKSGPDVSPDEVE